MGSLPPLFYLKYIKYKIAKSYFILIYFISKNLNTLFDILFFMGEEKTPKLLEGISSLKLNQEVLEEYNKEKGKIKQQIWLPIQYFTKLLEMKNKTGIAVNVLVSLITMSAIKNINAFIRIVEIEKPLEVRTKQYVYPCLICWEEHFSLESLKAHVKNVHKIELERLIKYE